MVKFCHVIDSIGSSADDAISIVGDSPISSLDLSSGRSVARSKLGGAGVWPASTPVPLATNSVAVAWFDCEMITPMMTTKGVLEVHNSHIMFSVLKEVSAGVVDKSHSRKKKFGIDSKVGAGVSYVF